MKSNDLSRYYNGYFQNSAQRQFKIHMKIQAILFDIGGVLVRTIDRAPRQALAERLGTSASDLETLVFGGESGRRAQLGQVDEAEQWVHACRQAGWPLEQAAEFREQFFGGDRLDAELLAYIHKLHQAYKTGIISNAMNGTRALIEGHGRWGRSSTPSCSPARWG